MAVGARVLVGLGERVGLGTRVKVTVGEGVSVSVGARVAVSVGVKVGVREGVKVGVSVPFGVFVWVGSRMAVDVGMSVGEGTGVGTATVGVGRKTRAASGWPYCARLNPTIVSRSPSPISRQPKIRRCCRTRKSVIFSPERMARIPNQIHARMPMPIRKRIAWMTGLMAIGQPTSFDQK